MPRVFHCSCWRTCNSQTDSPKQPEWQGAEMGMMICLDLITFTDLREPNWQKGGKLDPNLYNPEKLSTDQWMEVAKSMGAKYTVFVAKWCTGHMQWQTDLYPYSRETDEVARWQGRCGAGLC